MADEKTDVNNESGDDITLNFTAKIDTAKYAARLGIKLPDDSMDATLTGEDDKAEEGSPSEDSAPVPTEDATVSYGAPAQRYDKPNNCAATAQKCKAKNPLTCRYHGAKVIAQDIENQLRAAGVNGAVNVELTTVTKSRAGSEILGINISVTAPRSERKNVKAAMKKFFAQPGVEGDTDDIDYDAGAFNAPLDIDSLDPNAQAKWGMGQTAPAPSAPTPAPAPQPQPKPAPAPSTPPPAANPAPTAATPAGNAPTNTPAPQQSSVPPPPAPKKNAAKKSATKSGPLHPVAPPTDGSPSEEQKRKNAITAAETKIKTATGKDKKKLDAALKTMKDASDEMAAFEGSIADLDDAIANATDKDVSDALKGYLDDAEKSYGDLKRDFDKAAKEIDDWKPPTDDGEVCKDSIANTIAAIKASGKKVNPLLDNWQKTIDSKMQAAKMYLKSHHNLSDAELKAAEGIWKKNCKAIYDHLVKGDYTAATIISNRSGGLSAMLAGNRPVGANGADGNYKSITTGSFGYYGPIQGKEGSLCFTRILPVKAKDFPEWWGGNFAVVADPKKSVLSFFGELYGGAGKYGSSSTGNLSLLTDASLVSATGSYVTRDALTQDLSSLPPNQLLKKMGLYDDKYDWGNECHPVGGIHPENCLAIKQMKQRVPFSFTAKEKAALKQHGIKLYAYNGKEVDVDSLP